MNYILKQFYREWRFMLRQKYIVVLLACTLMISFFAVFNGMSEIRQQQQTIDRLKNADQIDRKGAQEKHNDIGSLAYYSFHLTYSTPSELAFAALGQRDIYPWKHRIRMLALEGQIYESDVQNAELAQAGKIDFVFVLSALSPLLIILLFHDLFAGERNSGRYDLLITTTKSWFSLWGSRITVRFLSIFVCLLLPFYVGAWIFYTQFLTVLIVTSVSFIYLIFWTLLSIWWGKKAQSAPRIASGLIGIWVLLAFVIPILGDLAINQGVNSPKGGDIVLKQREIVNGAWDLPKRATMNAFVSTHPEYKEYTSMQSEFEWKWYYAFQQVGDQSVATLSNEYRTVARQKYDLAGYVSLFSPPLLLQRILTNIAKTDALAAFQYEQEIREFHQKLRDFHYPFLFSKIEFNKADLSTLPNFEPVRAND